MDSPKIDWNHLRSFLATAEAGSFSAAAIALGTTQPTISRQVAALEATLGVTLFERVGQRIELTPAARDLVPMAADMNRAASAISRSAFGMSQTLAGEVRITATDLFASRILPPLIARMRAEAPEITIVLIPGNDHKNLQTREADIAVRNIRPTEPELIGTRLPDATGRFYAARSYLDRIGPINTLADLSRADFINIDDREGYLQFYQSMGFPVTAANFPYVTEDHNVMWEMVRAGLGIGPCDARVGDADPDVVPVLPDLPPIPFPVWLLVHRDVRSNRRVRHVFDFLAEAFKAEAGVSP
ncbi:LysR family transcriptional regulator [Loktanella sp. IMCC34160]|uniref:LysR family transcriptional regulator n=1 Tax=Loktanella sp. IMCC34160 TaxID=2510646 RepID=UPI00101BAE29|nr:LysR family transcriptional regulator [Loktanella sp. IMCC34160]RYG90625.1 LysR family transcriptional regulator [Loktanella sp. IMCC34160]